MAKKENVQNKEISSVSVSVNQPNLFYIQNGLTALSNDANIIRRDKAGNILIKENDQDNPYLVIEPTYTEISRKSFLNTVETRFQYFSFPAVVTATPNIPDIALDTFVSDPIYARYKPSENRFINANGIPSGILFDEVVGGSLQSSPNAYLVTNEIKNSGKHLRLRAKIQFRNETQTKSYVMFNIGVNGPERPELDRWYLPGRRFLDNGTNKNLYYVSDSNNKIKIVDSTTSNDSVIDKTQIKVIKIDIYLPNDSLQVGDLYYLEAFASKADTVSIDAEQSYFVITDAGKNVDTWNQLAKDPLPLPQPIPTSYGTTEVPITIPNTYPPFGVPGNSDGEEKYLNTAGLTIRYVWNAQSQSWLVP